MIKSVDQVVELSLCLLQLLDVNAELDQFLIKDLRRFGFDLSLLQGLYEHLLLIFVSHPTQHLLD